MTRISILTLLNPASEDSRKEAVVGQEATSYSGQGSITALGETALPNADGSLRPYVCSTCGTAFARKHDLTRHCRIHLPSKPFRCENCLKGFTRSDALRRHLHMTPRIKAQRCRCLH